MAELQKQIERLPLTSYELTDLLFVPVVLKDSAGNSAGQLTTRVAVKDLSESARAEVLAFVGKEIEKVSGQLAGNSPAPAPAPAPQA
jgi:hypothetical protein